MKPLISILMPAYNVEPWIADSIKSALGQTWERKEIIVVDDGSTDRTLSIARQFASKEVSVVTQSNQGAAAARNKAFALCQGDYIQWLDADDLLARDKITRQVQALDCCQSKRTLLSGPFGTFYHRYYRAIFSPSSLWCDLSPLEWLLRKMGQNCFTQTATWLVSRELAETAGPWDTRLLGDDDGEYFCRVKLASDGIKFVPEAKVYYRETDTKRLSHIGRSNRKMEAHFLSMQLHISYLRSLEESERVRAACVKYLQNWLVAFYPERLDIVQQAEQLAVSLGGHLEIPRLSWKYAWIQKTLGWGVAKRAQYFLHNSKESLVSSWDKVLFRLENRNPADE